MIIKNSTLIGYPDFLSYNSLECIFEISDKAIEAVKNPEHIAQGLTFKNQARDILIDRGYFWPGYSSASNNWVVDPYMTSLGNKIESPPKSRSFI